jgi:mRNA interferase MazF
MRRGEIWLADLDPVQGSEAARTRPVVIVSNEGANLTATRLGQGVVTVVPITTNTVRVYPFQVALPAAATGLNQDSKAQAEQVRSLDVRRLRRAIARVPSNLIPALDDALRLHLQL